MTERTDIDPGAPPSRRFPGRYVVYGMLAFGALFLGFMMLLAFRIAPAVDRYHDPAAASRPR